MTSVKLAGVTPRLTSRLAVENATDSTGSIAALFLTGAVFATALTGTVAPPVWRETRAPGLARPTAFSGAGTALLSMTGEASRLAPMSDLGDGTRFAEQTLGSDHPSGGAAERKVAALAAVPLSDQDEVLWLKEHSGLTWDQLGKVLGVSRRAVHLWASGGRMNESNAAMLREFTAEVRRLAAASEAAADIQRVRAALLAVPPGGNSIVERFRRRHAEPGSWGQPFAVHELLGALHDEPPLNT